VKVPIFVVSTKCIDPWVLEFVVSNITDNNQWENCISTEYSDITLVVEDVRFQSHKVILAARSDYFRYKYCEIIINCGVLIFADFVVHLNQENKKQYQLVLEIAGVCDHTLYHYESEK
jgi:hypothetical protein